MSERVQIAAIDIGSDTIHLLIADVTASPDGPVVRRVEQRGELIELGRLVATTGAVGKRAAARIEGYLTGYVRRARRGSGRVVIGATEALRRASDGEALVERLSNELGQPVRILSGAREAALGLAGAAHRLDPSGTQLLIDSGGASTEVTLTDGRRAIAGGVAACRSRSPGRRASGRSARGSQLEPGWRSRRVGALAGSLRQPRPRLGDRRIRA